MSEKSLSNRLDVSLARRGLFTCLLLAWLTVVAPRLGAQDIPTLPMADGSGDTPEMTVKLVPNNFGPVVNSAKAIKLSSLRGKIVLLDLFLSTCPHCEEHAPHVVEWYNRYKGRGFVVLGLATDDEKNMASVRQFMAKAKINYPVGFLTTLARAYYGDSQDSGVPQMVLFGPDGKMTKRTVGWSEAVGKEMQQAIEEQLSLVSNTRTMAKPGGKAPAKPGARKVKPA